MEFTDLLNLVRDGAVTDICTDSRKVGKGAVFVAVRGTTCDGHDFISQAVERGAGAVVSQLSVSDMAANMKLSLPGNVDVVVVDDTTRAAGVLAQAFYGNPADKLVNLAVTGTNGKTTVAYLVQACIRTSGRKCGLVSTVTCDTGTEIFESEMTTPDCLSIAKMQSMMVAAGCEYMVIEASSHALDQNRLAGIKFRAAAFTNLSGDHLDYHHTEQEYLNAKTKLFSALQPDCVAVLNKQSPQAKLIAQQMRAEILWYAVDEPADISAEVLSMKPDGTTFVLRYAGRQVQVKTALPGLYNVSNNLAAAGLVLAAGLDPETAAQGLCSAGTIPGRLERVGIAPEGSGSAPAVLIDYAHTDDALENVLRTLRPLCTGRLTVVFGCGGDRDKSKRPRMAAAAQKFADDIYVTSDNPRTEDPADIISDIMTGFDAAGTTDVNVEGSADSSLYKDTERHNPQSIYVEPDRKKAVESAIKSAHKDDLILIAGKGHETYQIIGKKKYPFSDKALAEQFLLKYHSSDNTIST